VRGLFDNINIHMKAELMLLIRSNKKIKQTFPKPYQKMKKSLFTSIFIILLVLSFSCEKAFHNPQVAILFAFEDEGRLLRSKMELTDSLNISGRIFWKGKLQGKNVVVVESGVGMTNAAMTTQLLIDKYLPEKILFTGICGAIDSANHIGDVVIPEKWVTHDYGIYNKDGFSPESLVVVLSGESEPKYAMFFSVDKNLLKIAEASAERVRDKFKSIGERIPQVRIGGIGASGNSFIDQKEKRGWLKEKFNAQIVDMETTGVVQVANINGVPILVIRSCSDLAGGSGSSTAQEELNQFFKVAADNSATFVLQFLSSMN
jgi:adenosylhomocysteine nucleosidase